MRTSLRVPSALLPILLLVFFGFHFQAILSASGRHFLESPWESVCFMLYHKRFIFDIHVKSNGCLLECVLLDSSSRHFNAFFDKTEVHSHHIMEGVYCDKGHVCREGKCVRDKAGNTSLGFALIEVLRAEVPKRDLLTNSDTYVNITIIGQNSEFVGKTLTKMDTTQPEYNELFKSKEILKSSTVMFKIFDMDITDADDYIGTVYASLNNITNNVPVKHYFPGGWLTVSLNWIAKES